MWGKDVGVTVESAVNEQAVSTVTQRFKLTAPTEVSCHRDRKVDQFHRRNVNLTIVTRILGLRIGTRRPKPRETPGSPRTEKRFTLIIANRALRCRDRTRARGFHGGYSSCDQGPFSGYRNATRREHHCVSSVRSATLLAKGYRSALAARSDCARMPIAQLERLVKS
jgi:hypothetical protein